MQVKTKSLCDELSELTIENEKLQFKIMEISENVVGMTKFEKLQSDYNIATSLIKYKNGMIESQHLEIEQLSLIIKELHQKVTATVQAADKQSAELENFVDNNIMKMNKKLNKVLQLFQDTLLYSSQTYYQEEIYKREKITKTLQDRVAQLEKKQKLMKKQNKLAKIMRNADAVSSSSQEEVAELDEQEVKKEEIMANLKQLNLLSPEAPSSQSPGKKFAFSPSSASMSLKDGIVP